MPNGSEHFDFIVVGVGHYGYRAGATILSINPWASLLLITDEHERPYERMKVNHSFAEFDPEKYRFRPIWDRKNTKLRMGVAAVGIDRAERIVRLSDGDSVHYNTLFLGAGATPRRLEVPGADLPQVHYVWAIGDAIRISKVITSFTTAMVVGTGILGLDSVLELRRRGKEVLAVARHDTYMTDRFDHTTGVLIRKGIQNQGAEVICNESVQRIRERDGKLEVTLKGSARIVDRLFVNIGVIPRLDLARAAGLETKTGILVDQYLRTSDPNIYSGGDAAEFPDGTVTQKQAAASRQGGVAALNAMGIETPYVVDRNAYGLYVDNHYYVSQGKPDDSLPGLEVMRRHVEDGYEVFYFRKGKLIAATQALDHIDNRYGHLVRREVPKELAMKLVGLKPVPAGAR